MAGKTEPRPKINMDRLISRYTGIFVFVALFLNIASCWQGYRHAPLREAGSRSLLAGNSRYFYDSGLAEPLPVFDLKAAMLLGADPDAAIKTEGLAVFAAITLLTLVIVRRRYGTLAGAMSAMFLGGNPFMGYYAMRGGSHLYALLFLLLFWYWFDAEKADLRDPVLAGVAGGLACLSRLDAAWFILLFAGIMLAVKRRDFNFKAAGISLALAFLLVLPYLAYQKVQYGNFFYAQELSLRRWSNTDRYGYNSDQVLPMDPMSPAAFVFRDGAGSALRRAFSGLGRSFSYELPKVMYYKFLIVLVFLGAYAAFVLKKDALLIFFAAAFLPVLALAPIKQVPATGGIELRYYLWSLWGFCALAGLGFQETMNWGETQLTGFVEAKSKAYLENVKKTGKKD